MSPKQVTDSAEMVAPAATDKVPDKAASAAAAKKPKREPSEEEEDDDDDEEKHKRHFLNPGNAIAIRIRELDECCADVPCISTVKEYCESRCGI